ncbi:MAG: metalloregulator ArsR/SmtB family transcription factor [Spongiibacteraceae bacterium]
MTPLSLFKCLADETRLHCSLLILKEEEVCVCELVEAMELSQPKISRHLALLKEAGLLVSRRKDQWMFYAINPQLADWARQILLESSQASSASLTALEKKLAAMNCRPTRC